MDHQLEVLGPERFQLLCQALFVKEFPGTVCFPIGQPDGGRDAALYSSDTQTSDFTVLQVKFARSVIDAKHIRQWVLDAVSGEVEKAARLIKRGAHRYLLATNAPGTAHLDSGSIDTLRREVEKLLGIPVICWWRDDINRRLDGSWDIKLRYPEILSGQDFLRLLLQTSAGENRERRFRALKAFLADQYSDDVDVKFKQIELHNKLLDLFVDLPFKLIARCGEDQIQDFAINAILPIRIFPGDRTGTFTIEEQDEELTRGGTASLLLGDSKSDMLRQVVVEGAPGQGKSTLAQYVCQVHRIRLLNKSADHGKLPSDHKNAGLRIPFKVDLRDLAAWLSGTDPFATADKPSPAPDTLTLETFLAHLVTRQSGGIRFDVNDLLELARIAPLLIVLDGLDEVADIKRRAEVVSSVTKAISRIRENCPDFRLIVTSRPAAFANSPGFDSEQFPTLQLGAVRRTQMQSYASRWMEVRHFTRREKIEFESILNEKMNEPHLRDLARNPMQLAILLSLIHTRGSALPDKRTGLYDAYVDLFFSREASKNVTVRQHIEILKDIHRYLAWTLHSTAEVGRGGKAGGRINERELKSILHNYLKREQHDTAVVDDIFGAMLERVVMIVSRIEGTYEFEVQPLREYFAARYLYDTAPYSPPGSERPGTKPDRFDAIARNFYWLNVVRFFCGCFSKGELLDLADRVKILMRDNTLGSTRHPVLLAGMLLSDWVFAQSPRAVSEVAGAISSREALRHLIPSSRNVRRDPILQIPARCGGLQIAKAVVEFLFDKETPSDVRLKLADFARHNLSADDLMKVWLRNAPVPTSDGVQRWLSIGRYLHCLQTADRSEIMGVIGDSAIVREILRELYQGKRLDCICTSDANVAELRNLVFSEPQHDSQLVAEPLNLLPAFLALSDHGLLSPGSYRRQFLKQAIDEFEDDARLPLAEGSALVLSQETRELSRFIAEIASVDGPNAEQITAWEGLIEHARQTWGDRPGILNVAITVCENRGGKRGRRKLLDAFDHTQPLCHRLYSLKGNAKREETWRRHLEAIESSTDRLIFHLCFWNWAPLEFSFNLADELARDLDSMSKIEWSTALDFLSLRIARSYYESDPKGIKRVSIPDHIASNRLRYLIGLRDQSRYGRSAFLSRPWRQMDQHIVTAEHRQYHALHAALCGEVEWKAALAIIKETYQFGAAYQLSLLSLHRPARIPVHIARDILANASLYPQTLWDSAIDAIGAEARKAVRAVSSVAQSERWFS